MTSKHAFEAVDRLMKELCNNEEPFSGKVVVDSGDFRQTLPIVRHGNRVQIIENCVKNSGMWCKFRKMELYDNKRLTDNDQHFKKWLLDIGNGKY